MPESIVCHAAVHENAWKCSSTYLTSHFEVKNGKRRYKLRLHIGIRDSTRRWKFETDLALQACILGQTTQRSNRPAKHQQFQYKHNNIRLHLDVCKRYIPCQGNANMKHTGCCKLPSVLKLAVQVHTLTTNVCLKTFRLDHDWYWCSILLQNLSIPVSPSPNLQATLQVTNNEVSEIF